MIESPSMIYTNILVNQFQIGHIISTSHMNNNNNKMRPCNKNQFQSIRKQKQNATTTQKYKKMKKIKNQKRKSKHFFIIFLLMAPSSSTISAIWVDFVGATGQAQKL